MIPHLLAVAFLCLLTSVTAAHEYVVGDLLIYHPVGHPTASGATWMEGYTALTNYGDQTEQLVAVRSAIGEASIRHPLVEPSQSGHAYAQVNAIIIPPGETVLLQPGGLHLRFDGLNEPFVIGDRFDVTFVLQRAGTVTLEFWVEAQMEQGISTDVIEPSPTSLEDTASAPITTSQSQAHAVRIESLLQAYLGNDVRLLESAVVDTVAIVSWSGRDEAGRAFLKQDRNDWTLHLLSGESLATPAGIRAQGLSPSVARNLLLMIDEGDHRLSDEERAAVNGFVGTILVQPGGRVAIAP